MYIFFRGEGGGGGGGSADKIVVLFARPFECFE